MDVSALIKDFDDALTAHGAERTLLCEVSGYPVYGYQVRQASAEQRVYISAGVHGDEPAGPLALLRLVQQGLLAASCNWFICPVLNPTGLAAGTRENGEGVDINRDYLKFSSLEAASHARWLADVEIDFAISLHEDWESSGFYFYEINQMKDKPERYAKIVHAVMDVMPMESEELIDDHRVRQLGWIYHESEPDEPQHWPEAIYLAKRGCPLSFTFETPSSLELDLRVACHCAAVRSVLSAQGICGV